MKFNKIIVFLLVCSMIFVNSTVVYADGSNDNLSETAEISETNIIENSEYMMSSIRFLDSIK